MLFLSKIIPEDVARVIPRVNWESGITYDMYKHNYNINNKAPNSGASSLYTSRFYVITSEFKVYACINNGSGPDFPKGKNQHKNLNLYQIVFRLQEMDLMIICGNIYSQ